MRFLTYVIGVVDKQDCKIIFYSSLDIMSCTEYHSDYYQEVKNILEELDNYAETHFTHEEEYMMQIRDPEPTLCEVFSLDYKLPI